MIRTLIIILLTAPLFVACITDRHIAGRFVMKEDNINVLILPPTIPLIKNHYADNPALVPADSLQILPLEEARFLNDLNDTAFVNYFMRSLTYHLRQFQVNVFGPGELDAFFAIDTTAFIFSVAQVELIEYVDKHVDMASIDTILYRVALPRTNLEKSTWFEFSELNNTGKPMQVLYSMQRTSDYYDGRFVFGSWNTSDLVYRHTPYLLETPDVYDLAFFSGQKNAQFIFDHLMNLYVADHTRRTRRTPAYFQYDSDNHMIRRAFDDRFIILDP